MTTHTNPLEGAEAYETVSALHPADMVGIQRRVLAQVRDALDNILENLPDDEIRDHTNLRFQRTYLRKGTHMSGYGIEQTDPNSSDTDVKFDDLVVTLSLRLDVDPGNAVATIIADAQESAKRFIQEQLDAEEADLVERLAAVRMRR